MLAIEDISLRDHLVRYRPTWMDRSPSANSGALSVPQVIGTSSFFRHSTPVRLRLFVLRRSKIYALRVERGTR